MGLYTKFSAPAKFGRTLSPLTPFNRDNGVYAHQPWSYLQTEGGFVEGKKNMWDVFLDDIVLDNNVELALANLDLNELVLEPITFDDNDPLEGSSSTLVDA